MIQTFNGLREKLLNKTIKLFDTRFNDIVCSYTFLYISEKDIIKNTIFNNIAESNVIIVNYFKNPNQSSNEKFLFFGFRKTVIMISPINLPTLSELFKSNSKLTFYFISDSESIFRSKISLQYKKSEEIKNFKTEMKKINEFISLHISPTTPIGKLWQIIQPCISGYLIQEGYFKSNQNRVMRYESSLANRKNSEIDESEYIRLRSIGRGSIFDADLVYHIQKGELYVVKIPNNNSDEVSKLVKREANNYTRFRHTFLPELIGITKKNGYLVIEFINGRTLDQCQNLEYRDKINIIYDLMITIEYLHKNHFIYRDLKPNNIIIDQSKNPIIIDFDRMILSDELLNSLEKRTNQFSSEYLAPEVNTGTFSYQCDIYSLGKIIRYIMSLNEDNFEKHELIKKIYFQCIQENPNKRPKITEIISEFYSKYFMKKKPNIYSIEYVTKLADSGFDMAQFKLGCLYYEGKIVPRNINKAIHYFILASKQNCIYANHALGFCYYFSHYIQRDIDKAIYYFKLASESKNVNQYLFTEYQNESNNYLGKIYGNEKFVHFNIEKSIYYYTLAANNFHFSSIYELGSLYYSGKYIKQDINKAIEYFTLASNRIGKASFSLFNIFISGKYNVPIDIKKALDYLFKAEKLGDCLAQYSLGFLHVIGIYVDKDINKAIYYLNKSFTNDEGNFECSFLLGIIYHFMADINKAIYFYKQASSYNCNYAKNNLGLIYKNGFGNEIDKNISYAIIYFSESINQKNDKLSYYHLSKIYFYDEPVDDSIDLAISLLIKSFDFDLYYTKMLLALACIVQFGLDLDEIRNELNKRSNRFISDNICDLIVKEKLDDVSVFEYKFNEIKNADFLYSIGGYALLLDRFKYTLINDVNENKKDIDINFYNGFGI